jgi:hypothetical protein
MELQPEQEHNLFSKVGTRTKTLHNFEPEP